jgi:hypothetical protein
MKKKITKPYDPETQRIVACVKSHIRKKTFIKVLKSFAELGLGLFLTMQSISLYEALTTPYSEIIPYTGASVIMVDVKNTRDINSIEKTISVDTESVTVSSTTDIESADTCPNPAGEMGVELCAEWKAWRGLE